MGGGSDNFIVTYSPNESDELVADKTLEEIISAVNSKKNVIAYLDFVPGSGNVACLQFSHSMDGTVYFSTIYPIDDEMTYQEIVHNESSIDWLTTTVITN